MEEWAFHATIEEHDWWTNDEICFFALRGLKLLGAVSKANKLILTSAMMTDLPVIRLRFIRVQGDYQVDAGRVTLPVYLGANWDEILFTVELNVTNPEEKLSLYERGVALVASSLQ